MVGWLNEWGGWMDSKMNGRMENEMDQWIIRSMDGLEGWLNG
jgi:hypothetical protein